MIGVAPNSIVANLSREEARHILEFVGYGRLSAPFWFIGLEEGLSSLRSADLEHNLAARGSWEEVMDVERAHLSLRENGEPIRISVRPPPTQTWSWMAKICRALNGNLDWGDARAAKEYVRRRLGRADPAVGETFLTELSPLPSKKVATNKEWLSLFRRAISGCDRLVCKRLARLRALIEQNRPQFVFCYGSEKLEHSARFKELLPNRSWQRITNTSELSESEGRISVLMPFFGNGRLSSTECQTVITEVLKRRRAVTG